MVGWPTRVVDLGLGGPVSARGLLVRPLTRAGGPELDAASARSRFQRHLEGVVPEAPHEAVDECLVHAADETRGRLRQGVEGAVPEGDLARVLAVGLVPVAGERLLRARRGLARRLAAGAACRSGSSPPARALLSGRPGAPPRRPSRPVLPPGSPSPGGFRRGRTGERGRRRRPPPGCLPEEGCRRAGRDERPPRSARGQPSGRSNVAHDIPPARRARTMPSHALDRQAPACLS